MEPDPEADTRGVDPPLIDATIPTLIASVKALRKQLDAEVAKRREAERGQDELQNRLDMVLPPLTPDREAIMERMDDEVRRLAHYQDQDGIKRTPAASRTRTLEIINTARHLLRYGNDAEAGNETLRAEVQRLRAALEREPDLIAAKAELRHYLMLLQGEHPADVYTGEGYDVWLASVVKAVLAAAALDREGEDGG